MGRFGDVLANPELPLERCETSDDPEFVQYAERAKDAEKADVHKRELEEVLKLKMQRRDSKQKSRREALIRAGDNAGVHSF